LNKSTYRESRREREGERERERERERSEIASGFEQVSMYIERERRERERERGYIDIYRERETRERTQERDETEHSCLYKNEDLKPFQKHMREVEEKNTNKVWRTKKKLRLYTFQKHIVEAAHE
jgi:hypothetical protein